MPEGCLGQDGCRLFFVPSQRPRELPCLEAGDDCSNGDAPPCARFNCCCLRGALLLVAATGRLDQRLAVVLLGSEQLHGLGGFADFEFGGPRVPSHCVLGLPGAGS